jgi:hypothetical protein
MHDLLFLLSKGIEFKSLNDMWMEYWDTLSIPEIAFNDRMRSWLGTLGYTGSYSDRYSKWVKDTPMSQSDCFVDPESGEFLANWTFDCGLYNWNFDPAYPAILTDNEDGSVHLKTDSNFGSLVPDGSPFPAASWVIEVVVRNVIGNGKMSFRRLNGTWVSTPFTTDGTHRSNPFSGGISEIHCGADGDPTFEADFDSISLRQVVAESIVHNGVLVVHNGEQITHLQ